jgi:hypothetical protein
MNEQEITPEQYQKAVFDTLNYGVNIPSARHARMLIEIHMDMMEQEKAEGKPKGELIWFAYLSILKQLMVQKDFLEAKELSVSSDTFLWTFRNVR